MKTIFKAGWQRKTGYFGHVPIQSIFTLSGTSGAENTSSFLAKLLDISGQLFCRISSHYLQY
jgi:hypothetical protein